MKKKTESDRSTRARAVSFGTKNDHDNIHKLDDEMKSFDEFLAFKQNLHMIVEQFNRYLVAWSDHKLTKPRKFRHDAYESAPSETEEPSRSEEKQQDSTVEDSINTGINLSHLSYAEDPEDNELPRSYPLEIKPGTILDVIKQKGWNNEERTKYIDTKCIKYVEQYPYRSAEEIENMVIIKLLEKHPNNSKTTLNNNKKWDWEKDPLKTELATELADKLETYNAVKKDKCNDLAGISRKLAPVLQSLSRDISIY